MDALREADVTAAKETSARAKFEQAVEMMELGIVLQRRKLAAADPDASEATIDARLLDWMCTPR